MKVVIIGGVAGGASAAARLRRLDETAEIIILEKGPYVSYANCGLPYYIGNVINDRENLLLQTPENFNRQFVVDARVNSEVLKIDRKSKKVIIKDLIKNREYDEKYDKLIISVGSIPFIPKIDGLDICDKVFSLWTVPDADKIKKYISDNSPKKAVVIGGGFIGLEMVENLVELGIDVSLVELDRQVMQPIDFEMAQLVHSEIVTKGVSMFLEDGISLVEKSGEKTYVVLKSGKKIEADLIILSIGIRPQTKFLENSGILLNQRGGIVVNEFLQTNDKNIFAVGDAVEILDFQTKEPAMVPLAGPTSKQGRITAAAVLGKKEFKFSGSQGTSIAKIFDLQVASTGWNEKRLIRAGKKLGKDYEVVVIHSKSHAGYYPGATQLTLKLIFSLIDRKILGAQIVGYDGCDKRIDVIATVIRLNGTVDSLTELELAYAPPFSSAKDPVNMVGFQAENILNKITKVITYDKISTIKDAQLVDVREKEELEGGKIPNSILMPLGDVRKNFVKLDKERPVIVYCASGFRAYVAQRILSQNGFKKVYNLTGGYNLYKYATKNFSVETDQGAKIMKEDVTKVSNIGVKKLNCSGLSCPGPIQKTFTELNNLSPGEMLEIRATDPGFAVDIDAWCKRTGNVLMSSKSEKGEVTVVIKKGACVNAKMESSGNDKTIIVFSGDLDKAIASFIIANGSLAMGRKVTMFFTFWGLNILRKSANVKVKKTFIEKMFGFMMPRGAKKLGLSKMNMGGMGATMIKGIMKKHNVPPLQEMMKQAIESGANIVACTMSMDLMGIKKEELIDGIGYAGVATFLGAAESSDTNLFI